MNVSPQFRANLSLTNRPFLAIGSNLKQLAANCNTTATHIGSVFIVRGFGAVFGAIASAKLYRLAGGNRIMLTSLVVLSGLIMALPFVRDVCEYCEWIFMGKLMV